MKRALLSAVLVPAVLGAAAFAQSGRDYITIVGSSTVYPFTTTVAEQFGKAGKFKTPKVESTGTGGGFKLFCSGVGAQYPDLTNASRAIKPAEVDSCKKAGVTGIIEVKVGYDGITVSNSKKAPLFKLSRKELFLALAKGASSGRDSALRRLRLLHQVIVDREEQGETLSRLLPGGLADKLRLALRGDGVGCGHHGVSNVCGVAAISRRSVFRAAT
jgi:hypothetical protein